MITFGIIQSKLSELIRNEKIPVKVCNSIPLYLLNKIIYSGDKHRYLIVGTKDAEVFRASLTCVYNKLKNEFIDIRFVFEDWVPLDDGVRGFYLYVYG